MPTDGSDVVTHLAAAQMLLSLSVGESAGDLNLMLSVETDGHTRFLLAKSAKLLQNQTDFVLLDLEHKTKVSSSSRTPSGS